MTTATRTDFIDRTRAEALKLVMRDYTSSHSLTSYDQFVAALQDTGLTTALLPYTNSPKAKKLHLRLFLCPAFDWEGTGNETKQEYQPTKYFTCWDLSPMEDFMQDLWQINLTAPWHAVHASISSFNFLLSERPQYSRKSGRGFAYTENLQFWDEQFAKDWNNHPDKIIEPANEFNEKQIRWSPVCFNPSIKF